MRFLFWNIQKKDTFFDEIVEIVKNKEIDILALAEFPQKIDGTKENLLSKLKNFDNEYYAMPQNLPHPKVIVFSKIPDSIFYIKSEGKVEAYEIAYDEGNISIIFNHGCSKFGSSETEQRERAQTYNENVRDYEKNIAKHERTVICGDMNMNPFDYGMVTARAFNATMNMDIAKKSGRNVERKSYPIFYNPMWNLIADGGKGGVTGTYYYDKAEHDNIFWHMLDQIVYRASVDPFFDMDELEIISNTGTKSLLTREGIVDKNKYSDHLPLKFRIEI